MHTGTRLRIPYLEPRHLLVVNPPSDVRRAIDQASDPMHLPPDLLLAVVMVETSLRLDRPFGTWSALPARVAHRLYLDLPNWPLEVELAAAHLAVQLEALPLELALLAYHLDPAWVHEAQDTLLSVPLYRAYVQAVLTTLQWLSEGDPEPLEVAS